MQKEYKELPEGDWYVVSDYGYGDGSCNGPYTAIEALNKYNYTLYARQPSEMHGTLIQQFNDALDTSRIHYITDRDMIKYFEDVFQDS